MRKSDKEVQPWVIASYISGAGILLVIYIMSGFWVSKWIVAHFEVSRAWIAVGTSAGLVFGVVNIIVLIYRLMGDRNG